MEGEVSDLIGGLLVKHRVGSIRGYHILDVWLDLVLMAGASEHEKPDCALLYGVSKQSKLESFVIKTPEPELARALIGKAATFCLDSWCQPRPLLPDLLFKLACVDLEKRMSTVEQALKSEYGELMEDALLRCFPDIRTRLLDDEFVVQLMAIGDWLLEPMLAHMRNAVEQEGTG